MFKHLSKFSVLNLAGIGRAVNHTSKCKHQGLLCSSNIPKCAQFQGINGFKSPVITNDDPNDLFTVIKRENSFRFRKTSSNSSLNERKNRIARKYRKCLQTFYYQRNFEPNEQLNRLLRYGYVQGAVSYPSQVRFDENKGSKSDPCEKIRKKKEDSGQVDKKKDKCTIETPSEPNLGSNQIPCKVPTEDPCKPKTDKSKESKQDKTKNDDRCKKIKNPCETIKDEDPSIKPAADPCKKPKSTNDPCKKPNTDPCKPKEDPCKPKEDPCKSKEDPCKPKEDPCKPKEDPCKPKEDPCKKKQDDPCKKKQDDPCKKPDPCKPKDDPSKKMYDPCKKEDKDDPCKPKEDPCKKKQDDPCQKPKNDDPCKTPEPDPCKPKDDPSKKMYDPCKKEDKDDPCKPKEDPCKKKQDDPCKKPKNDDPCKKPKPDPCKKPKDDDPCKKPKADPCEKPKDEDPSKKPKGDPCKKPTEDPCKDKKDDSSKKPTDDPCKDKPGKIDKDDANKPPGDPCKRKDDSSKNKKDDPDKPQDGKDGPEKGDPCKGRDVNSIMKMDGKDPLQWENIKFKNVTKDTDIRKRTTCKELSKALQKIFNEKHRNSCDKDKPIVKMVGNKVLCDLKDVCCLLEKFDPSIPKHCNIPTPKPGDKILIYRIGDVYAECTLKESALKESEGNEEVDTFHHIGDPRKIGDLLISSKKAESLTDSSKKKNYCKAIFNSGESGGAAANEADFIARMAGICKANASAKIKQNADDLASDSAVISHSQYIKDGKATEVKEQLSCSTNKNTKETGAVKKNEESGNKKCDTPKSDTSNSECKPKESDSKDKSCSSETDKHEASCKMVGDKIICELEHMSCVCEKADPCNPKHKDPPKPKPGDKEIFCKVDDIFCVCKRKENTGKSESSKKECTSDDPSKGKDGKKCPRIPWKCAAEEDGQKPPSCDKLVKALCDLQKEAEATKTKDKSTVPCVTESKDKDKDPCAVETKDKDKDPCATGTKDKDKDPCAIETKDKDPCATETKDKDKDPCATETKDKDKDPCAMETKDKHKDPCATETKDKDKDPCAMLTKDKGKDKDPCATETKNKDKDNFLNLCLPKTEKECLPTADTCKENFLKQCNDALKCMELCKNREKESTCPAKKDDECSTGGGRKPDFLKECNEIMKCMDLNNNRDKKNDICSLPEDSCKVDFLEACGAAMKSMQQCKDKEILGGCKPKKEDICSKKYNMSDVLTAASDACDKAAMQNRPCVSKKAIDDAAKKQESCNDAAKKDASCTTKKTSDECMTLQNTDEACDNTNAAEKDGLCASQQTGDKCMPSQDSKAPINLHFKITKTSTAESTDSTKKNDQPVNIFVNLDIGDHQTSKESCKKLNEKNSTGDEKCKKSNKPSKKSSALHIECKAKKRDPSKIGKNSKKCDTPDPCKKKIVDPFSRFSPCVKPKSNGGSTAECTDDPKASDSKAIECKAIDTKATDSNAIECKSIDSKANDSKATVDILKEMVDACQAKSKEKESSPCHEKFIDNTKPMITVGPFDFKPDPCDDKKNTGDKKKDPCVKKSASKSDPCGDKKADPCASKSDSSGDKKTDPCVSKSDSCGDKKADPCVSKSDSSGDKKADSCAPKSDISGDKKADPCVSTSDSSGDKKADPCVSISDSSGDKKVDPCASKSDSCDTKKSDPPAKESDSCAVKLDPCAKKTSDTCAVKPSEETCATKKEVACNTMPNPCRDKAEERKKRKCAGKMPDPCAKPCATDDSNPKRYKDCISLTTGLDNAINKNEFNSFPCPKKGWNQKKVIQEPKTVEKVIKDPHHGAAITDGKSKPELKDPSTSDKSISDPRDFCKMIAKRKSFDTFNKGGKDSCATKEDPCEVARRKAAEAMCKKLKGDPTQLPCERVPEPERQKCKPSKEEATSDSDSVCDPKSTCDKTIRLHGRPECRPVPKDGVRSRPKSCPAIPPKPSDKIESPFDDLPDKPKEAKCPSQRKVHGGGCPVDDPLSEKIKGICKDPIKLSRYKRDKKPHCDTMYDANQHKQWSAVAVKGEPQIVGPKSCRDTHIEETNGTVNSVTIHPNLKKSVSSPRFDQPLPEVPSDEKDFVGGSKGLFKAMCKAFCPKKKKKSDTGNKVNCEGVKPKIGSTIQPEDPEVAKERLRQKNLKQWPFLEDRSTKVGPKALQDNSKVSDSQKHMAEARKCKPNPMDAKKEDDDKGDKKS